MTDKTMMRFQPQADGRWAVYDGSQLIEAAKTMDDLLFDPRYRDEMLLMDFALRARRDGNFALAYANLKLALAKT